MADWGPIRKAVTEGKTVAREDGAVVQFSATGGAHAPTHPQDYDATDGRHGRELRIREWPSVDDGSGIANDTDWGLTGRFPDGPGVWRQT